jgi:hypothetical protein
MTGFMTPTAAEASAETALRATVLMLVLKMAAATATTPVLIFLNSKYNHVLFSL